MEESEWSSFKRYDNSNYCIRRKYWLFFYKYYWQIWREQPNYSINQISKVLDIILMELIAHGTTHYYSSNNKDITMIGFHAPNVNLFYKMKLALNHYCSIGMYFINEKKTISWGSFFSDFQITTIFNWQCNLMIYVKHYVSVIVH